MSVLREANVRRKLPLYLVDSKHLSFHLCRTERNHCPSGPAFFYITDVVLGLLLQVFEPPRILLCQEDIQVRHTRAPRKKKAFLVVFSLSNFGLYP